MPPGRGRGRNPPSYRAFYAVLIKLPPLPPPVLIKPEKKRPFEEWFSPFLKGALKRLLMQLLKPLKSPLSLENRGFVGLSVPLYAGPLKRS